MLIQPVEREEYAQYRTLIENRSYTGFLLGGANTGFLIFAEEKTSQTSFFNISLVLFEENSAQVLEQNIGMALSEESYLNLLEYAHAADGEGVRALLAGVGATCENFSDAFDYIEGTLTSKQLQEQVVQSREASDKPQRWVEVREPHKARRFFDLTGQGKRGVEAVKIIERENPSPEQATKDLISMVRPKI